MPFVEAETDMKVALPPSAMQRPLAAVRRQLNDLLFTYVTDVNGMPMAYRKVGFKNKEKVGLARVMGADPWMHVDILASLIVFKPEINETLCGKITLVGASHVGLLCFGIINATLNAVELAKNYTYSSDKDCWENEKDGVVITEGEMQEFKVKGISYTRGILTLEGYL
jgi:DNA-directed RNA polymerase subunit E'/Rpb7